MAKVVVEVEEEGSEATAKKIKKLEEAIEKLEKKVEKLSGKPLKIPTDPAQKELEKLRKELGRLERSFDRAAQSVKDAKVALKSAEGGLGDTRKATRRLADANLRLVNRGRQLIEFSKRLPPELRKVATGLDKVEKEAQQAARAFRQLSASKKDVTGLVQSIGQLRTGVGALIAALGIRQLIRFGGALVGLAADAVETKKKFDSLIPALRAFTGSTELAEEVADRLADTANRLKIPMGDLLGPFLQITAATKETTLTLKEQSDLFESAILTVRAFGLSTEEAGRLVRGFAQVAGKGTLQMEELRQQIGEVAFNALPALAKALGKTVPQLIDAVTNRAIDAETALRGFAKGLREANEAAGLAQLDTLKGDLGAFARATEEAERALADGLEPGLRDLIVASTEFLVTNKEAIISLGELGSAALKGLGKVIKVAEAAGLGLKVAGEEAREFGHGLVVIGQGFEALGVNGKVLIGIGENIRQVGATLTATTARAEEFVEKVTKGFRRILNEGAGTSEELLEQQKKNFREQAKAAGVAAEEIIAITKTIADKVGKIQEDSFDRRKELTKEAASDLEQFGKLRVETERRIANRLAAILATEGAAFTQLSKELVEIAEKAAAARVEAERKATEESLELFERLRTGASKVAEERVKDAEATSSEIEKIALELEQKIEKIREEFVEKRLNSKVDRVKLEKKTADQIAKLVQKAAEDTIKEIERVAKAAEKAAKRRIKAEEKIRKEIEKSTKTLKDLADQLNEIAKKEDDAGGSALGSLADEATTLAEKLEEAADNLGKLFGDPGIGKDPTEFLNKGFKDLETLLGGVSTSFGTYSEELQQLGGQTEEFKDFTEQLKDAISKVKAEIESFGPSTQESLGIVLSGFEALVEQGFVSQQAFEEFGPEIKEVLAAAGDAAKIAAEKVSALADKSKDLETLGEAGEKGADGIKKIGEESERTGTKIKILADGTKIIVNETEKLEAAGKKGAEGVKELGDEGKKAAESLEKVATAAEKLQEPILDEDQATNLEALGEAAEKAKEPLGLVAEPVEKLALGAKDLSETLPGIVGQVGKLTPQLEALKKLLTEDPVDLKAIATQLQEISTPLERIGTSLSAVKDAVVALPEPLDKIREPAKELLELVAKAAKDDSFVQVATALERIAKSLPEIPEPIKAFLAALKGLSDLRDKITQTLKDIADGLADVGNEKILAALGQLEMKLAEIVKDLGAAKTLTDDWKGTLEQLIPLLETAGTNASTFADRLRSDLVPALESTKVKASEAQVAVGELKDETGQSSEAFIKLGENSHATLTAMVADAAAAQAAMASLRAEIEATTAAAANLKAPTSGGGS